MSDQSQTAANKPAEARLCKMGCGFFGNGATGDCCSKCWNDMQKKQGPPSTPMVASVDMCKSIADIVDEPQPMDVDPEPAVPTKLEEPAEATSPKKKKASYKSMMAGMLKCSSKDIEKEKESLRNVTGGGTFSKIDKI